MKSRGFRNNNPLNIRRNGTRWKGLRLEQTDKSFFQFEKMAYGYRASIKTLRTYQRKYKLHTITEMISRWAPPFENNTKAYIAVVSKRSNIDANIRVDMYNKETVVKLIEAMAFVENGSAGDLEEIKNGYDLA